MEKFVEVLPNKEALLERSLIIVLDRIRATLKERSHCTIALSGGSTPKPLYEAIAKQSLPWEKIQVFWGDERYVPPDSDDSNQNMARQAWLNRVKIPQENIHPMPTEAGNPEVDAKKYEEELRQFFDVKSGEFPVFDIILLGMGDDGHTASLFPHTEALQVRDRSVTVGSKNSQPRLTFTLPLINNARCVIFLVAGESKQTPLAKIFAPEADENTYPACSVQPTGELYWLLDRAAGKAIENQ